MPVVVDTGQSASASGAGSPQLITVGLVNNMPDAALESTERQFTDLIGASTRKIAVRLLLFSIAQVPRSPAVRQQMQARYRDIGALWDTPIDGLIVTGTEPRARNLKDEPYWHSLARLIAWAQDHAAAGIWSCLAAHAAVLCLDGVERRTLPRKCSGVFECTPVEPHPLMQNVNFPMRVPHSRCNDLPEAALTSCGYRILTHAREAGVDMFARHSRSFHLFLQGHPEYDADTLLREYRRDIGRYLRAERDDYPPAPQGYFDDRAKAAVEAFRTRALTERRPDLLKDFPLRMLRSTLSHTWRSSAIAIYENWFAYLQARKAERRAPNALLRRAWRDWPKQRANAAAGGRSAI